RLDDLRNFRKRNKAYVLGLRRHASPRAATAFPLRRRAPVLPPGRPRLCLDDPLALGSHLRGGHLVEDSERLCLREIVLVLPPPGSVRMYDDVECPIGRVETIPVYDEGSLEVHVPADEPPIRVPAELDRVRVARPH